MSDTRREFLKKATLLTGSAGLFSIMPESIKKALAIEAEKGSTYLDAEHIVFLMQENRSFDHCYGTLQGVRGFDDPRAMHLPNKNKVWLQTNKQGETYIPFNLDIKNSKATWMQSLPHSWDNQVDARNEGKMDGWLESKKSGNADYEKMPLTMGFYDRKDIPFYYALADAFTVCDQNFSSALTGTSPNRAFYWTGTIREEQHENSPAKVYNGELDFRELNWKTFPERLEKAGVSWAVYQNELSVGVGFNGEEEDWLANFTDNDLEFFRQYNVRLHKAYQDYLPEKLTELQKLISELKKREHTDKLAKEIGDRKAEVESIRKEMAEWNSKRFNKLSDFDKNLHQKAFITNVNDPDYHQLETLAYDDNGVKRDVKVPKGDVLHQFREDVNNGKLPMVSWLVASSNFSDHPSSPWYGAWYISEVLDILTKNPEVWKKTIFILNYDENDGYFDHVSPFTPPHTAKPETGNCSAGIHTAVEHVTREQIDKLPEKERGRRESPIGLGFRVPMVIASPWSRGGWVNSQVFDHTSCLQFLETFLDKKAGISIKDTNISDWRRTICGDLTSVFRPYNGEKIAYPVPLDRNKTIQDIYNSKFKGLPHKYNELTEQDIKIVNERSASFNAFPKQEKGKRKSCALPYQINVNGHLNLSRNSFEVTMKCGAGCGVPFNVSTHNQYQDKGKATEHMRVWDFAVKAKDEISYKWPLNNFENGTYQLALNGPNGFFREFAGDKNDPKVSVTVLQSEEGELEINLLNLDIGKSYQIIIADRAYKQPAQKVFLKPGQKIKKLISLQSSYNWYDLEIIVNGYNTYVRNYAGRVENGQHGFTDPSIGA
jgi:phospholipase C